MTVSLTTPLKVNGKEVKEVTLKALTMGDQEDAMSTAVMLGKADNQFTISMCLLSRASDIPYDTLRSMNSSDGMKLLNALNAMVSGEKNANPTEQGSMLKSS